MSIIATDGFIKAVYWKVYLDTPVSGSNLGVSGIELRTAGGLTNIATDNTKTSCMSNATGHANAIDGNTATLFTAAGATATWWMYQFATATTVDSIKIIARNDASYTEAPTQVAVFVIDELGREVSVGIKTGLGWSQGANNVVPIVNALGTIPNFRINSAKWMALNG